MLDIYNKVVEIIGVVPPELEFIYAICAIGLFIIIIYVCIFPIMMLYKGIY